MKIKIEKAHTVKSYSALPKKEREKWGFYIRPSRYLADRSDGYDLLLGSKFEEFWKKNYPIQAFFRETVCDFFLHIKWGIERRWRKTKMFFISENESTEDLVPREYMDKSELIPYVILQMTLDFQKEANNSYVDYVDCVEQKEFKDWLDKTCKRIKVVLPYIKNRHNKAYDPVDHNKPYEEAYKYVNYWEKLDNAVTDRLCKEIIDKRHHFWT